MKTKQLVLVAIILATAGAAFAEQTEGAIPTYGFLGVNSPAAGAYVQPAKASTQAKTREQVVSELKQAQADGGATTYGFLGTESPAAAAGNGANKQVGTEIVAGKTRAEVAQELRQAQADGSMATCGFLTGSCPNVNGTNVPVNQAIAHSNK